MRSWQILRKATEQTVAALWVQTKPANRFKRGQYIEALEPRTLLNGSLLKDIDITPAVEGVFNLTHVPGTSTYFFTHSDADGRELWKSDGTTTGTVQVKDIDSGRASSNPNQFMLVGSTLFFAAVTDVGRELWKSDGSSTGTVMVKDIYDEEESSDPMMIAADDGTLYFTARTSANGRELWKSDGSSSGTVMVKDIYSGSNDSNISTGDFAMLDHNLYFTAQSSVGGKELWMTDGTSSGTVQVKDIVSGTDSSYPSTLFVFDDLVYFSADDGSNGYELWQSDGSETGTVLLKDINSGSSSSNVNEFKVFNDELYFRASTSSFGSELWKTDGSETGTIQVRNINPGSSGSSPSAFVIMGNLLYFAATTDDYGHELWVTDGSWSGTNQVKDINDDSSGAASSNPNSFVVIDDETLFFCATGAAYGTELWMSDGSDSGTVKVKDIEEGTGSSWPTNLIDFDGTLFFKATTNTHGDELWKSDGTCSGTVEVKDIWSGTGSSGPMSFQVNGETLYFVATNDVYGCEFWKSDGTTTGTAIVKDVNTGTHHSDPNNFAAVGNMIYFAADDGETEHELWKSDGTESGTVLVKDIWTGSNSSSPMNFTAIDDIVYFTADTESYGRELWKSNGTATGTVMVKDIAASASSNPDNFRVIDDTLFFTAWTSSTGNELWKSDGTETGTVMVKEIKSGSGGADFNTMVVMDDLLYFSANSSDYGPELWVSDGTSSGTVMVKDIVSGTGGSGVNRLAVINDATLYFAAGTSAAGSELWKSDGTESGTVMVKDIVSGSGSSNPDWLTAVGSTLYFRATTSSEGTELWKSDGTSSGTVLVKDIESGSSGSNPDSLLANGNRLFFFANTTPKGNELWVSDGTSSGTVLVKDINEGATSTNPSTMILVDRVVYMSVNEGWSNSVWRSDATETGTWRLSEDTGGGSNCVIGLNRSVIYAADDGTHGRELWMTPPPLTAWFDKVADVMVISWPPIDGATSYTLERSDDGEDWDELETLETTSYFDDEGEIGHYYRISVTEIEDPISAEILTQVQIPYSISVWVTEVGDHGSGGGIQLEWDNDFGSAVDYWFIWKKERSASIWLPLEILFDGNADSYFDTIGDASSDAPPPMELGDSFEYRIEARGFHGERTAGYVYAGWDAPAVPENGTILLVVDETQVDETGDTIRDSLDIFKEDLIKDGWNVMEVLADPVPVPTILDSDLEFDWRTQGGWPTTPGPLLTELQGLVNDTFGPWKTAVSNVKTAIRSANTSSGGLSAILLVGNVPVPYSGGIFLPNNPEGAGIDGHVQTAGAWPADLYYGMLDADESVWTDNVYTYNDTWDDPGKTRRKRHINFPGDGKFDQVPLPSSVKTDIPVSRIDFSDMPIMNAQNPDTVVGSADDLTETDLYNAYFDKNHAFRTGAWNVNRQALLQQGAPLGYPPISFDPTQFSSLVGPENIHSGTFGQWTGAGGYPMYIPNPGTDHSLNNDTWLWTYLGSGGGEQEPEANYDCIKDLYMGDPDPNVRATVSTYNYADTRNGDHQGVFNMLWGSFTGYWDKPDSLLRSVIADPDGWGLTSAWGGHPNWVLHGMGLGEPIANSLMDTINSRIAAVDGGVYELPGPNFGHHALISLQGDLTLQEDIFADLVTGLKATTHQVGFHDPEVVTRLTWGAPDIEGELGQYYVYRATTSLDEPMELLTPNGTSETYYIDTDDATVGETVYYMVRASRLEETPSGTYYNLSPGVILETNRIAPIVPFDWFEPPQQWVFEIDSEMELDNVDVSLAGLKWDRNEEEFDEVEFTFDEDFEVDYNETTNVVTVQFVGENEFGVAGTIPSGQYSLLLSADVASGGGWIPVTEYQFDFVFVAGDADGDGDVDSTDLSVVTNNQNETGLDWNDSFEVGDFDNDGDVDQDDADILDELYGLDLNYGGS